MKILIVNVNSHIESTGKIVYGLYNYLKLKGNEVRLCYRGIREPKLDDANIIPLSNDVQCKISGLFSKLFGYEGIFSPLSTRKLIKEIEIFKPDVVHLFNLPGYYLNHFKVLEYLKEKRIPTVYSMMDEFVYTGKCTYPYDCEKFKVECKDCPQIHAYPESWFFDNSNRIFKRKQQIYKDWDLLTITGIEWSCNKARMSAISSGNRLEVIPHPINSKTLYTPKDSTTLRRKLGIPDDNIVILTVTDAADERKGAKYYIELAERLQTRKDISFVFVGYNRSDFVIPSNMRTTGFVSDQNLLAEYYSLADLYVCVSLADTFPTTCLNALACGTKVLGFNAGGVPYCAPKEFGTFVPVCDVDALANHVARIKKKTLRDIETTSEFANNTYSEEVVDGKFHKVYESYFK